MTRPIPPRLISALTVFSLVFPVIYTVAYYNEWVLFWFYPLVGELHLSLQPTTFGPSMMFYGWIAIAAVVALAAALVVPSRWAVHLWAGWSWVVPLAATLFTFVYETRWFPH
jgi:hypothetical protein